jgi:DNA-binding response OmpR family regulator
MRFEVDLSKKLILIVDDNFENRKFLGLLLLKDGYDVGVAENGQRAFEFIENEMPDLILLDVIMPEIDGFAVCEKIKLNTNFKHIPIIFLTAKASDEDILKGFEVGGSDYIFKPFNPNELLARVKTHVEINVLKGIIPVCSNCKKIRNDEGYWRNIEEYLSEHTDSMISHGMCLDCAEKYYGKEKWFHKLFEENKT